MSTIIPFNFQDYDHSFCEATIYDNGAEYLNSTSALFISFMGIFGLYHNTTDINSSMMYYSLILNGITSCAYHHTHYLGFGLMDRFSMILVATYCYNVFMSLIINDYPWTSHLLRFMSSVFLLVLSTFTGLHNEMMFNILFGFFLLGVGVFAFILSFSPAGRRRNLMNYFALKGLILISVGCLSWITTENLCLEHPLIKYLMGHSWWHITVSLGGYFISLIPLVARGFTHIEYNFNIPYIRIKDN